MERTRVVQLSAGVAVHRFCGGASFAAFFCLLLALGTPRIINVSFYNLQRPDVYFWLYLVGAGVLLKKNIVV